jgi:hypothetical protein
MPKQLLITRPCHDSRTAYIHSFTKSIVIIAKENTGVHVTDLEGPKATRKNLEESIKKSSPKMIFLNGHGDHKTVLGHENKVILDKNNVWLMKGSIVYALACESLIELGPTAIKSGVITYIGYEEEFKWTVDLSRTSTPDKDRNAAPFRRVCFVLGKNLLSGVSVKESIKITQDEYKKLIRNYGTSKDSYGDSPLIGFALAWDLTFLGMIGDFEASF